MFPNFRIRAHFKTIPFPLYILELEDENVKVFNTEMTQKVWRNQFNVLPNHQITTENHTFTGPWCILWNWKFAVRSNIWPPNASFYYFVILQQSSSKAYRNASFRQKTMFLLFTWPRLSIKFYEILESAYLLQKLTFGLLIPGFSYLVTSN